MKKLIKFKPSAKTYYDIAEDKYDRGDLESAIYYFFKAYQKNADINSLIALGEIYCEMGEPEEGLKYLFMALDQEPDDEGICHSVAQCFLDMDDEETAFFYFQPRMTIKRFKYIIEESEREGREHYPQIRVLEKSDDMIVGIAVKLLSSGDITYAREILLTVKPDSEHYVSACNLLALSALELEKPEEALECAKNALKMRENVDSRCNMMLAYFMLGQTEDTKKMMEIIESQKIDLSGHKTISLAYIRMGEAKKAAVHLKILLDASKYNRDALVSYALANYSIGETEMAKQLIVTAGRTYPNDIAVREIAAAINRGDRLTLFPLLEDSVAAAWLTQIDEKLTLSKECGEDFFSDVDFKDKIAWLFQSRFTMRQTKAAMVLGKYKKWQGFFRGQLLDNYMDLAAKKVCLFSLLLSGVTGNLGIVIEGMYASLKIKFPEGMDEVFKTAYCLAFASFAFSDSCFESRLLAAAKKLQKKYNSLKESGTNVCGEDILAAVMFYFARHKQIKDTISCAHLFGCDHSQMQQCLKLFDIKKR